MSVLMPSVGSSLFLKVMGPDFDTPCPGGLGLHSDLTACLGKQTFQGTIKICINIRGIHPAESKMQGQSLRMNFPVTQPFEAGPGAGFLQEEHKGRRKTLWPYSLCSFG